jgi:hypothetical protein
MASQHQSAGEAGKPCGFRMSKDSALKIRLNIAQGEENRDVVRGGYAEEVGDGRNNVLRLSVGSDASQVIR